MKTQSEASKRKFEAKPVLAYSAAISVSEGYKIVTRWPALAAVMAAVISQVATAANAATATACKGSLGAVTIQRDLDVPRGAACSLLGTTVTGNVTVEGGLTAGSVHIRGDLTADHANYLGLYGNSTIGGNVTAAHTMGFPPISPPIGTLKANFLCYIWIGGDVKIEESSSHSPWIIGDPSGCSRAVQMGGNLEFHNNVGSASASGYPKASGLVSQNYIGGNLDCHDNAPPASGILGSNSVNGKSLGECSSLGVAPAKPTGLPRLQ